MKTIYITTLESTESVVHHDMSIWIGLI